MIAPRPDRVQIWASQLAANDFPGVCAMTGQPAQTWRKFRFATPPRWTYWLLFLVCLGGLGLIVFGIVVSAISQRASGHLPLTWSSRRLVNLAFWVPLGLLIAWAVIWFVAIIIAVSTTDEGLTTIAGVLFWIGGLLLIGGLVGRLVITRLVGPQARVMEPAPGSLDRIVELRNVNPGFVQAMQQMQASRMAQSTSST